MCTFGCTPGFVAMQYREHDVIPATEPAGGVDKA